MDWDGAGDAVLGGRPRLRGVSVVDDGRGLLVFGGRPLGRFVGRRLLPPRLLPLLVVRLALLPWVSRRGWLLARPVGPAGR